MVSHPIATAGLLVFLALPLKVRDHFLQEKTNKRDTHLFSNFCFIVDAHEQFMSGSNVSLNAVEFHCKGAEFLLVCIEHLQRVARHHLQPQQLLVSLINLLNVLLILNLQLVEVHLVQHLSHLFFLKRISNIHFFLAYYCLR